MSTSLLTTPFSQSDEYSDDESNDRDLVSSHNSQKRSSRACDPCRKSKSKCIKPKDEGQSCINCQNAGIPCTFMGPSFKRGPPKGYIHAIEQRLRQVESVLGAIISSSDNRAQSIVADLRTDDFARSILHRVDIGPFGSSTRITQHPMPEDTLVGGSTQSSRGRKEGRTVREPRLNREIVSTDRDALKSPTLEWQDQIIARLAGNSADSIKVYGPSGSVRSDVSPSLKNLYTLSDSQDADGTVARSAQALGQLSLDENDQVRFHSEASGIPLLERSSQVHQNEGDKLWRFSMSRFWPVAVNNLAGMNKIEAVMRDVQLPPIHQQDHLLRLYFEHFHPFLPVIHQASFMQDLQTSRINPTAEEAPSRPSTLLLLAIFCSSSRYLDKDKPMTEDGQMWEAGCDFLGDARYVLGRIYHESRISTCQALLILGLRECGIGSEEQGWLFIGMAIRMAQDLGLHCAADRWQRSGVDLFTPAQKQERKQIWWACVIADKYVSTYLGHPTAISELQYDTDLPQEDLDNEHWQVSFVTQGPEIRSYLMASFRASASLAVISGQILEKLYPIRDLGLLQNERDLNSIEKLLEQWYITLPRELLFDPYSQEKQPISASHIPALHIQYWCTVILLFRKFIPQRQRDGSVVPLFGFEGLSWKAFDLCQGAAIRITTILTHLNANLFSKYPFPQLPGYLLTAGIMHVAICECLALFTGTMYLRMLTVSLRPFDAQANSGLQLILSSLRKIEISWPGAVKCREMLERAKMDFEQPTNQNSRMNAIQKRPAHSAFQTNDDSEGVQQAHSMAKNLVAQQSRSNQDQDSQIMENILGTEFGRPVRGSMYGGHGHSTNFEYKSSESPNAQFQDSLLPDFSTLINNESNLRDSANSGSNILPINNYQWDQNTTLYN